MIKPMQIGIRKPDVRTCLGNFLMVCMMRTRFQVEYVKEPRDIDEAVNQVVDFLETRHRPLMTDSSSDRRDKKHVRSVSFAATDCEDNDDEGEEPEYKEKRAKRKCKTGWPQNFTTKFPDISLIFL